MEVTLKNLTKVFKQSKKGGPETVAVDHINITIPSGKLIGLLGPSGCGKSTTLYMIAGLHNVTEGDIYFGDQEVSKFPPEKRGIGLVFQNYALYPHLTVQQNIMFPLENQKMEKDVALARAYEAAQLVGIEELMDRKPSQLSGGQQQRVAIARALVKKPEVLLLDEPLSNLDARLRLQTREEIKRIQQDTKTTTIFVTHDQEEAMSISDQIVVMNFGVVQQVGEPQAVYDEPANMFVAKFLGNPPINIIPANIVGEKMKKVEFFGQKLKGTYKDLVDYEKVFIGLRPEFIRVEENGAYKAKVVYVESIGRDKTVVFKFEGQKDTYKAIIPSEVNVEAGQDIKLDFTKLFIFAENGERLV